MKKFSFIPGRGQAYYTFLLAFLICSFPAFALPLENKKKIGASWQTQQNITGTIRDASGPLPGVIISVKGNTSRNTVSDLNGKYTITANSGDILVFSFVGYTTREVAVTATTQMDILMVEDTATLEELTINAGYYSIKQKESTGSIARITSKDIEQQPVSNPLAVLQGRMAGVSVIQDSGTPGGNFQINIRGINSLRADGNAPLYIVNGVPFSSETIGSTQTSGYSPSQTSPLNSINPADIESIEVLKDADATAIYGSRGANGVVLITTKKGKVGKTSFDVSASTAFGSVTRMLDLMDTQQYLQMRKEAFANDGFTEYPNYAYDVNGTWDQNRYTDWQKVLIGGTAEIRNLQAGVSGGSASTQYVLNGTYRTETTVLPGDFRYDKGAVHFNMNHKSDDGKFSLRVASDYVTQKNDQPGIDLTTTARTLAPNAPSLYTPDGELNWENSTWGNPLAELNSKFLSNTNSLNANILVSYNFTPDLQFRTSMGFTDLHHKESRTRPSTMYDPAFGMGSESSSLNINTTTRRSWIIEPQLNYSTVMGKGRFEALVGTTLQRQQTDRLYQSGYNFASNNLIYDLASAAVKNVQRNDQTIYKYQAAFARVNFNWDSKYIINVTGRRDGSSRFGPGKRFVNFGAVGAAWLFSNEAFLSNSRILSFGKLRSSYGTTGNDQIGDYQFLDTYASSGNNYQGVTGLQPTRLYNPAFGWETNKKLEIALELGFFKDRLFLTGAYYRNRSSDQLVGIPMPATTGFTSLNANLGATVENKGLEFTLRSENFKGKDFTWNTSFNISANRNKLIAFPGLEGSPYASTYVIGKPINILRLYNYTGMDPQTGLYQFEDANGDGQITYADDRTTIADLTPKYYGGLQNQFSYKGFQLDFLLQFVKQKNMTYRPTVPGDMANQLATMTSRWQQPGDQSLSQPYTAGFNGDIVNRYFQFSDSNGAITDASFIRLKNISLSYMLPLPEHAGIKCRLFLQCQNLLTFTSYEVGDPELSYSSYLPPLKVYSAGVQLNF